MRIVSWNIRAGGGKRVTQIAAQIKKWNADLVALCEFRGTPASRQLAHDLADLGFGAQLMAIDEKKLARNGLLIAARVPLKQIRLRNAPKEPCRWLLAQVQSAQAFTIGAMHIPNYVTGRKYPYHDAVLDVVGKWRRGKGLLVGDTNTGMPGLDEEVACFNRREKEWMEAMEKQRWHDAFRHLKGRERVYTWYSPNGRNGFRLDQAFVNRKLIGSVADVRYVWGKSQTDPERRDALSDHAALLLDLDLSKMSSPYSKV